MIALLVSITLAVTPAQKHPEVDAVVASMTLQGMSISVEYRDCGFWNAYYYPSAKKVVICNELFASGTGVVQFVTAHEMAHAIIHQLALPIPGSEEAAADELAAMALAVTGRLQAVLDMAVFYAEHPGTESVRADHQSNNKRGWVLVCYGAGAEEGATGNCADRYKKALRVWGRLLAIGLGA